MNEYEGKVAVITGAANGIGEGLAKRCASMGMKLGLTDIDAENLARVCQELKGSNTEIVSSAFDVGNYEDMEAFAKKVFEQYGKVDLLFNNAGVAPVGNIWSISLKDWKWGLDTNVMGIVHGIKAFVPAMLKQDTESRVINTASVAGLGIVASAPVYVASKHAAVALTEVLNLQLQLANAKVRASVLCPAFVKTDIYSDRHRTADLQNEVSDQYYKTENYSAYAQKLEQAIKSGITVEEEVDILFAALAEDKFYILTHPEYKSMIETRMQNILQEIRPSAS